jgi:methyl-accepting chemotaxis protein
MFKNLTVKSRMLLVVSLICCLFALMSWLAVSNSNKIKDQGLEKTAAIMLEDQKAKLQVATHSVALTLGQAIEGLNEEQKVATIRKLIDQIRFENDK